jgi:Uma2 family endonuclease
MSTSKQKITSAELWDFIHLPENARKNYELINGEIVEEMPSNPLSSEIAGFLIQLLRNFLDAHGRYARVTGEQGGYDMTDEDTFAPDVAVILKSRQARFAEEGFNPIPPDFAIEVVSPSDLKNPKRIRDKLAAYEAAKIPLVWWVYQNRQQIDIYLNGKFAQTAGLDETLDGGDVLPGFTIAVKAIFEAGE